MTYKPEGGTRYQSPDIYREYVMSSAELLAASTPDYKEGNQYDSDYFETL